jgi:hypothetical protein
MEQRKQVERSDGKKLWRNTTDGAVGAVVFRSNGEEKGVAVKPRSKIWLSDEDAELTRHAHQDEKNSPFVDHDYEIRGPDGQVIESGRRPLLVPVLEDREETGDHVADSPHSDEAPPGEYAEGEETGGAPPDPGSQQPGEEGEAEGQRLQTAQAIRVPPPVTA